jgi:uncharacterized protein YecE (DUF72 family)
LSETATQFLVGTSGWSYDHWQPGFYPPDLPKSEWLSYYSQTFPTVELNMSFYRTPFSNMIRSWLQRTPADFIFTVKASRYITHVKRLQNVADSVRKNDELTVKFSPKGQCVLYQLPPSLPYTAETRERILKLLDMVNPAMDTTIEFRHPSWWNAEVHTLLQNKAIFCCVNGLGMPVDYVITHPRFYLRFHGERYNTDYSAETLQQTAESLQEIAKAHHLERVYVYFNNDAYGFAVRNAQTLREILTRL